MKKVALLLLVVWCLFYAARNEMLPDWVPIPEMFTQTEPDSVPPPRLGGLEAPIAERGAPMPDQPPARNARFAECRDAANVLQKARMAGSRGWVLKEGDRVLSESERKAVVAEKQRFWDDNNCREEMTPQRQDSTTR